MKESNFDTKSHSAQFEELNHIFKEVVAELREIEPVMIFHVNPFSTVGNSFFTKAINAIYEAKVGRLELDFWSYRRT
jgi:hypothetical protein